MIDSLLEFQPLPPPCLALITPTPLIHRNLVEGGLFFSSPFNFSSSFSLFLNQPFFIPRYFSVISLFSPSQSGRNTRATKYCRPINYRMPKIVSLNVSVVCNNRFYPTRWLSSSGNLMHTVSEDTACLDIYVFPNHLPVFSFLVCFTGWRAVGGF